MSCVPALRRQGFFDSTVWVLHGRFVGKVPSPLQAQMAADEEVNVSETVQAT